MNSNLIRNKLKLAIAIVIALGLTVILSQTVFVNDTPEISTTLVEDVVSWPKRFLATLKREKTNTPLTPDEIAALPTIAPVNPVDPTIEAAINFSPIGQGVSTGTEQDSGQKYVKIEAGTVVEVQEFTLIDGRRIKVINPLSE